MAAKKVKAEAIDLGELQSNIQNSSRKLKAAQTAFQRASDALLSAQEDHKQATIALNQGMATLKAQTYVQDILAR